PTPGLYSSSTTYSKVFLTKFNFNGQRAWSTYFGIQTTAVPLDYIKLYNNLIVINNDPYILTDHISASGIINNMATNNAFLNNPPHFARNTTLTKFNSSGNRIWTTYLWSATGIQKTENNDIMTI